MRISMSLPSREKTHQSFDRIPFELVALKRGYFRLVNIESAAAASASAASLPQVSND